MTSRSLRAPATTAANDKASGRPASALSTEGEHRPLNIAPDLIASLAKKVSGNHGADYQFNFTITGDFKRGGITFSVPLGTPKKPYKGSSSP